MQLTLLNNLKVVANMVRSLFILFVHLLEFLVVFLKEFDDICLVVRDLGICEQLIFCVNEGFANWGVSKHLSVESSCEH